jgi:hypothetical protein
MKRFLTAGRVRRLTLGPAIVLIAFVSLAIHGRLASTSPASWLPRVGVFAEWLFFAVYGSAAAMAPILIIGSAVWIAWRRRGGRAIGRTAFAALSLGISCLFGLALLETGATLYWMHKQRPPWLPGWPIKVAARQANPFGNEPAPADRGEPSLLAGQDRAEGNLEDPADEVYLVVIGESSGRGEPYHPWLSVGQIVGWQLQRLLPSRRFKVDVLARPGATLRDALEQLRSPRRRPDAILLYSGHNEFFSRYSWARSAPPVPGGDEAWGDGVLRRLTRCSSVFWLFDQARERQLRSIGPPRKITRPIVDVSICTPEEYARIVSDFRRLLDHFATYCERIGALPMAVIPAGNDGGYPPSRSSLAALTGEAERDAFVRDFLAARPLEAIDPRRAIAAYRALVDRQPGFAETHFRLAKMLECCGEFREANTHYILARDLDRMPVRCPSPLQDVSREVAATHPSLVLVDGPRVLRAVSRHGIVDDELIQDGHHPTLIGHVAIAQDLLDQLFRRGMVRGVGGPGAPTIDAAECAAHFGIDASRWTEVCRRAACFYERAAYAHHDPTECLAKARRYAQAAEAIRSGTPPDETHVPGVGIPAESKPLGVESRSSILQRPRRARHSRTADAELDCKCVVGRIAGPHYGFVSWNGLPIRPAGLR